MVYRPGENIRDRLNSAMWMPGKPGKIVLRSFIAEIVEQQKRVELGCCTEPKSTVQQHSGPFKCLL
jgi:hypothetical protein